LVHGWLLLYAGSTNSIEEHSTIPHFSANVCICSHACGIATIKRGYCKDQLHLWLHATVSCLVDLGETAEAVTARHWVSKNFNCVVIGADLRAPIQ
jgi:hypothetical protein